MQTLTEKKPDAISEGLSRMYDVAIDHAIEVVREKYISTRYEDTCTVVNPVLDSIVATLKSLKK